MVDLITISKEVTKATREKIMVIRIHDRKSNRKRINALYVKDFTLAK